MEPELDNCWFECCWLFCSKAPHCTVFATTLSFEHACLDLRLQHCQIHYWAATAARLNVLDHHLINHSDAKKIHCWICHRAKVLFLMHTSRRWIIAWMCFGQWSNIELQLWQQCCSTPKSILRSALRVWVHCAVIKEHRLDAAAILKHQQSNIITGVQGTAKRTRPGRYWRLSQCYNAADWYCTKL